jgi:ferredoxin
LDKTLERIVFACSCEETMSLDEAALARGCGGSLRTADQLCRRQLGLFKAALAAGAPVTVGCTQEAPLFSEVADEVRVGVRGDSGGIAGDAPAETRVNFVNVREHAGWSSDGIATGPKMAALLAAAAEPAPAVQFVSMESRGIALVYGRDEVAVEAGRKLADHLDVTVLLTNPAEIPPPRVTAFPVLKGTIAGATGHLGAFSLRINDFAQPAPSSRERLAFGPARDGATSACDLVLDLSGGLPLFPAHDLRSGYLRADPRDPAAVERLVFAASHLVGTFDKPKFVSLYEDLCAHSRSQIVGCTRCLDLCPTGAITPAGDHVAVDPYVCGGCGDCAAACPTGAVTYEVPDARGLLRRLRTLLSAYRAAGGVNPVLLLHDAGHGEPLIDALARFGPGLPANVIPLAVNEVTQVGPEAAAAAFAYGAAGLRLLTRAKPRHDLSGLHRTAATANAALAALGYGTGLVSTIETDDPDALRSALDRAPTGTPAPNPAGFFPEGTKRGLLELSFRELRRAAPAPADTVALPAGAPFGGLAYNAEACTLCLACVSACPTAALTDNPERPMLRFTESLCVQCGLCAATCPEDAIQGLLPRLDFPAWDEPKRVLKEEEPFHCVACAKPFGTKSAIEAVVRKLSDRHWMFSGTAGQARLRVLMMCEDCRVEVVVNESFDPHGAPPRPRPRTTEDYLAERAKGTDGLN